ncbi:MAG: hypothetical protein V6Z86_05775 [Hyphomicrobiales bacterium]
MSEGFVTLGQAEVTLTKGRGHTPEELTGMCVKKIISVGPEVPEPARAQALAFKDHIAQVVLHYVRQAQRSARTTHVNELMAADMPEAAEHLRKGS